MYMSIIIQGSTIRNSINQNAAKPHQFNTQHSTLIICAPSNVIPLSLFFPKAVVC